MKNLKLLPLIFVAMMKVTIHKYALILYLFFLLLPNVSFSQNLILHKFSEVSVDPESGHRTKSLWQFYDYSARPMIGIASLDREGRFFQIQFFDFQYEIYPKSVSVVEYIGKERENGQDIYKYQDTKEDTQLWVLGSWLGYLAQYGWPLDRVTTLGVVYEEGYGLRILAFQ